ncbi:hypothetical protein DLM77_09940 [Leptospira yasudae]|uniref:Uncharacterized protein n=1 Tax=Leptospira yasudae TaxID=2202201 RepID=A0ABX9M3I0_9LEPT|nr:hypothetical protein DLM77_09940 [Leptospira yasudae]
METFKNRTLYAHQVYDPLFAVAQKGFEKQKSILAPLPGFLALKHDFGTICRSSDDFSVLQSAPPPSLGGGGGSAGNLGKFSNNRKIPTDQQKIPVLSLWELLLRIR